MKFNCGYPDAVKHRAKGWWMPWFAWHPVRVGPHDCRWLEIVERKGTYDCGGYYHSPIWDFEYRARRAK